MSRGRLIRPLVAVIEQLDTEATRAAGNYDATFRTLKPGKEPIYGAPVEVPAQVEMTSWETRRQTQAGDVPGSKLALVFHFLDLEKAGLVVDGRAVFRKGDRLTELRSRDGTKIEELVSSEAGGLYVVEVQPAGLGLGGRRNLLLVFFQERARGLTSNP